MPPTAHSVQSHFSRILRSKGTQREPSMSSTKDKGKRSSVVGPEGLGYSTRSLPARSLRSLPFDR